MKIIEGCGVVTVDAARTIHSEASIVIDSDRIAAIGSVDDMRQQYPQAQFIDARRKVAFPGFVNIHTHTVLTMLRGSTEDLGAGSSLYGQMYPMRRVSTAEDRYALGMLGCLEGLRFGTTTIVENYQGSTDVVPAIKQLRMRAVVSEMVNDAVMADIRKGRYEYSAEQADRQMQTAVDLIDRWHGAENGRITCQVSAHAPDTTTRPVLEMLRDFAEQRDLGLHIHLAQSPREVAQVEAREGMRPVEFLASTGYMTPRTVAAHCIYVRPEEIQLIGASGMTVAHCAVVFAKGGVVGPIMGMQAAGANIALGSDNMSEDMIEVARVAMIANRIREMHGSLPQRPNSEEVLEWMTINGAKALGLDHEIGSLEVGKKADIVLIDTRRPHLTPFYNPVTELIHYGLSSDVDTVYVDGEVLVEDGKVLVVDELEVIGAAQRQADDFWRRFEAMYGSRVMSADA